MIKVIKDFVNMMELHVFPRINGTFRKDKLNKRYKTRAKEMRIKSKLYDKLKLIDKII